MATSNCCTRRAARAASSFDHDPHLAILTVSDKSSRGEREDAGGPAIREALSDRRTSSSSTIGSCPTSSTTSPRRCSTCSERDDVDLILTTGGTGLAPRDVTPQATLGAIEYEVPGIAEAMRAESLQGHAGGDAVARCGRGAARTLIVNLPGSPKAVRETLAVIVPALAPRGQHAQGRSRRALAARARHAARRSRRTCSGVDAAQAHSAVG